MPPAKSTENYLEDANDIIRKQNAEIRELKKEIRDLQITRDTADEIRQTYFEIAAYDPTPPSWLSGKGGQVGARGVPICFWSDIHAGEVVKRSGTNGANVFNKDICERRLFRLFDITVDLCYEHMGRAKKEYPGIIIPLGGDNIGGENHEELMRTNDLTPIRAIYFLSDILCAGLEKMASKFGKVYVPAVVGNHGRTTRKPPYKDIADLNFDYALYLSLIKYFAKTKQSKWIHIDAPETADCHFQSYGVRYMLTHGDNLGVKGGDGIIGAIGPIMRGVLKMGQQTHKLGVDFDEVIMGHWHQLLWLPGVTVNNSLKGYDEYCALKLRAPPTRPSQALWFNHPDHGTTARWEIFLEGKIKAEVTRRQEWVTWQKSNTTSD